MTIYEIPLSPQPQTFAISIAGTVYRLTIQWNRFGGYWVIDIADAQGNDILCGVPMLAGRNLLGQYDYLGFNFILFCGTDFQLRTSPTFENLGITSHLWCIA